MADQIKLRRRQKREKSALAEKMRECTQSPPDSSRYICVSQRAKNCTKGRRAQNNDYFIAVEIFPQPLLVPALILHLFNREQNNIW